jgi:hypothetical protein
MKDNGGEIMTKKSKPFTGIVLVGLKYESGYDEVWEILEDRAEFLGTMDEFIRGETGFDRNFEKKIVEAYESAGAEDIIRDSQEVDRILHLIDLWHRENSDVPEDYSGYLNRKSQLMVLKLIKYGR